MNLAVNVKASFNPATGEIRWRFQAVDPQTGDYPEDPFAGFLPPFNPQTGYEIGWVEFTVKPKSNLLTGTVIRNQAFVEFDLAGDLLDHPAPKSGPWINTIDAEPPQSQVLPLPAEVATTSFPVQWSGTDAGSGIASYTIYFSENGGPLVPWLENASVTGATFPGKANTSYAFFSSARDHAGNEEASPILPDAVTRTPALLTPLLITGIAVSPAGNVAIHWSARPGRQYRVEYKNDLNDPAWTRLATPILLQGDNASVNDPQVDNTRFYRVVQE
jgi:hypothetical protein